MLFEWHSYLSWDSLRCGHFWEKMFYPPKRNRGKDSDQARVWWGNTAPQDNEKRFANPYASLIGI